MATAQSPYIGITARARHILFAVIFVLGIGCALVGSIKSVRMRDLGGAVARVNDVVITRSEFEQIALRVGARTRAQRTALLQHLVDEELLLQRAAELELLHDDPTLRKRLVAAAIDASVQDFARDSSVARTHVVSSDATTREQEGAFKALLARLRKTVPVLTAPVAAPNARAVSR